MMIRSFLQINVLIWADVFAAYVMWMMMVYLTDVWKLEYTHAATIINIWMGSVLVLPTPFAHLADAFLGNFSLLLLTTISYALGLGLLWMSTPPVLAKSYGNCTSYEPECIGGHQNALFYTGLALTAMGMAGHLTSYMPFVAEQIDIVEETTNEEDTVSCASAGGFCLQGIAVGLVPLAGYLVVVFVKPWSIQFGLCALFTLIATLVFLSGVCSYKYQRPLGSPMTTVFRVFFASFTKMMYRPSGVPDLYTPDAGMLASLPHTKRLSCLDKAATVLPHPSLAEQEQNRWRLCSVTEVEETKTVIRMIPIWLTIILCGIVSSIGNTYFLEQANHLDRKVGRVKVPIILFLWFYNQGKQYYAKLYVGISTILHAYLPRRRHVPPVGIAVAMVFAVLSCITAAKVETGRLGVVESHGLIDKPDEKVPMTIFWLLPQFVLLGASDGIYHMCVTSFFGDQIGASMTRYMYLISEGVFGVGIMGGALSVYVVGQISERGGNKNWFQSTLNMSKLDNYYWVLATLSAANFLFYVGMVIFYRYRSVNEEEVEEPEYDHIGDGPGVAVSA